MKDNKEVFAVVVGCLLGLLLFPVVIIGFLYGPVINLFEVGRDASETLGEWID